MVFGHVPRKKETWRTRWKWCMEMDMAQVAMIWTCNSAELLSAQLDRRSHLVAEAPPACSDATCCMANATWRVVASIASIQLNQCLFGLAQAWPRLGLAHLLLKHLYHQDQDEHFGKPCGEAPSYRLLYKAFTRVMSSTIVSQVIWVNLAIQGASPCEGFLKWMYPQVTMGFNMSKSWSFMTWMIWGTPYDFGNLEIHRPHIFRVHI